MSDKIRLLILGYSNIVQRRVLPAARKVSRIDSIAIASCSRCKRLLKHHQDLVCFSDYRLALREFAPNLVYVSLANIDHAHWVRESLKSGSHVIVDKPAFLTLHDAIELINLSQESGLLLAEAIVYATHPQIAAIKQCFSDMGSIIRHISSQFTFPPLDPVNFRYRSSLGGGALVDLGPYAMSVGRLFFESPLTKIYCSTSKLNKDDEVETAFSMMAIYSEGQTITGHFDFNGEYTNQFTAIGPELSVDLKRFYSTPANLENVISCYKDNQPEIVVVPRADSFEIFIQGVTNAVVSGNHETYTKNLLADARTRAQLIYASLDNKE